MNNASRTILAGLALALASTTDASASIIDISGVARVGDFDGDDTLELVVSSPETDCGKGAVYVVTTAGIVTAWSRDTTGVLGTAACNDLFGAALAVADFDDDGYDDLAVAAPGADDSGHPASGSVHILYGSGTGLTDAGDQLWNFQAFTPTDSAAWDNAHYGDALTSGDFNCDGYDDLAIGVPRYTAFPGFVEVIYGDTGGLSSTNYHDISGPSGSVGLFGAALTAGNFNGDQVSGVACDDLIIAAPYETVGTSTGAGLLVRYAGGSSGLASTVSQTIHQDVANVADAAESGDRFGWRIGATQTGTDIYDDLLVTVPGDACTGVGTGQHTFLGSATGIATTTTSNTLACNTYGCSVLANNILGCQASAQPIYGDGAGSAADDVIGHGMSRGLVWGGQGGDAIHGDHGDDILFGGGGDDYIVGGPGRDVIIAGAGDDIIDIDLDCMIMDGEIVDGGPGTDTIRSHLTSTELATLGLVAVSIENYTTIDEGEMGDDACERGPNDDGPVARPIVSLAWTGLTTPSSVLTNTTGQFTLALTNHSPVAVVADLEFELDARGERFVLDGSPVTLSANGSGTFTLDVFDFIPTSTNLSNVNLAVVILPTSAALTSRARLTVGGEYMGHTVTPTVFGHVEFPPSTLFELVLYREGALHDTYNDGDLNRWRANAAPYSGDGKMLGRLEAHGSRGIAGL